MMGDYGFHGGFGLGGGFMFLWWIVIIVLIVVVVKWLNSSAEHPSLSADDDSKVLEILKERYARGEIDEEEFERRKRHLKL